MADEELPARFQGSKASKKGMIQRKGMSQRLHSKLSDSFRSSRRTKSNVRPRLSSLSTDGSAYPFKMNDLESVGRQLSDLLHAASLTAERGLGKMVTFKEKRSVRPWEYCMILNDDGIQTSDVCPTIPSCCGRRRPLFVVPEDIENEANSEQLLILEALERSGLVLHSEATTKHGKPKLLILINATSGELSRQEARNDVDFFFNGGVLSQKQSAQKGGLLGIMKGGAHQVIRTNYKPAERLKLIYQIIKGATYAPTSKFNRSTRQMSDKYKEEGHEEETVLLPISVLNSPLLDTCFPLHDVGANERLLLQFQRQSRRSERGRDHGHTHRHRHEHEHGAAFPHALASSATSMLRAALELVERMYLSDASLEMIRSQYGDEIGFRYAWLSFYTRWLSFLAPGGFIVAVAQSFLDQSMQASKIVRILWVAVLLFWATFVVDFWERRCRVLRLRWGLTDGRGQAVYEQEQRQNFKPYKEPSCCKRQSRLARKDRAESYPNWLRIVKTFLLLPVLLAVLLLAMGCVLIIFWGEMWIIFEWGGCTQVNLEMLNKTSSAAHASNASSVGMHSGTPHLGEAGVRVPASKFCMSSAETKGVVGWLFELIPGLAEAALLELLIVIFRKIASVLCTWQNWRLQVEYDKAYVMQVFFMEFVGCFGWFLFLAFYFVPNYEDDSDCMKRMDSAIFGEKSIACLKVMNQLADNVSASNKASVKNAAYELRLEMMKGYMITPFVVNQLLRIALTTVLPAMVQSKLNFAGNTNQRAVGEVVVGRHGIGVTEKNEGGQKRARAKGCNCPMLCALLACILGHERRLTRRDLDSKCDRIIPADPRIMRIASGIQKAALPKLTDGIGDDAPSEQKEKLHVGCRVRIMKPGRQYGKTAEVMDVDWGGRVKVRMESHEQEVKSYVCSSDASSEIRAFTPDPSPTAQARRTDASLARPAVKDADSDSPAASTGTSKGPIGVLQAAGVMSSTTSSVTSAGWSTTIRHVMIESTQIDFDIFDKYTSVMLQFCWVTLFSAVFPLGALFSFAINCLEIRCDFFSLGHIAKRPIPKRAFGIGQWMVVLRWVVWIAVVVNIGLLLLSFDCLQLSATFQGKPIREYWKEALLCVFVTERAMLTAIHLLRAAFPNTPAKVMRELKRSESDYKKKVLDLLKNAPMGKGAIPVVS